MAEGLLRSIAEDRYDVFSAGTHPTQIHPMTVDAMREVGIDVSGHTPKAVEEFSREQFDYVISLCDRAKESCPEFPGSTPFHWGFDDPTAATGSEDQQLRVFRRVREELMGRIRLFVLANKDYNTI